MTAPTPARHVLISGASGGIGAALAEEWAGPGVLLSLTGRDVERLAATAHRCMAKGATVETACLDVTDRNALMAWVAARDQACPVDVAVANAGMTSTIGPGDRGEDWSRIEAVLRVNLLGALATLHPLIEPMATRGHGQLGLMSSLGAYAGMPISPIYNASKAAVKIYGEGLRGHLAPRGVGVTVICPGFVESAMSARYPGPTPYLLPASKAAKTIRAGLENNRALVAFPWPMWLVMRFLALLPNDWSLALQRSFRF